MNHHHIKEVREQVYTRCYGCNKSVLVEIRYPKGHRPIAIEFPWCEQCQKDEDESTAIAE